MKSSRDLWLSGILAILTTLIFFLFIKTMPFGVYFDTAAYLLNAHCLRHFGVDEWGHSWPLSIQSFNDFKTPGLTYLLTFLPFEIHEMMNFRIFSSLLTFCSLLGFLGFFFKQKYFRPSRLFYAAALSCMTLLSSWVWVVSRFPASPIQVFAVSSVQTIVLFLYYRNYKIRYLVIAALCTGVSVYAYHSYKFLLPFAALSLFVTLPRLFRLKHSMLFFFISIALALPVYIDMIIGKSAQRFNQIAPHQVSAIFIQFFSQFSGIFFFVFGDTNKRHHHAFLGELPLFFAPFFFLGLIHLLKKRLQENERFITQQAVYLLACLFPACLAQGHWPNALRALPALFPLLLVTFYGFKNHEHLFKLRSMKVFLMISGTLFFASIVSYFTIYPKLTAFTWCDYNNTLNEFRSLETHSVPPPESSDHRIETVYKRLWLQTHSTENIYCKPK